MTIQASENPTLYGKSPIISATTNITSPVWCNYQKDSVVQAYITGTGAVSATVTIYGTLKNQATQGIVIATLSLSGTTTDTKGAAILGAWPFMYAVVSSITGTGATVTLLHAS